MKNGRLKLDVDLDGRLLKQHFLLLEKDVCRVYVSAKKFPNIVKEMMLKASLYTMFVVEKNRL
ncbi:MAG: hypothetical protein WA421_10120 [Nitrososphaeraceae archaeon]